MPLLATDGQAPVYGWLDRWINGQMEASIEMNRDVRRLSADCQPPVKHDQAACDILELWAAITGTVPIAMAVRLMSRQTRRSGFQSWCQP